MLFSKDTINLLGTRLYLSPLASYSTAHFVSKHFEVFLDWLYCGRSAWDYESFQQQPQGIVIASLVDEVNNPPTFSKRTQYWLAAYAILTIKATIVNFVGNNWAIQAQYSQDLTDVQQLIQKYG